MKNLFQENRNAFLLLLGLFSLLLLTVYFLFYRPLQDDLEQTQNEEISLQDEIAQLEEEKKSLEAQEETSVADINRLRFDQIIPDSPDLETLILTLNEIELVTDSTIEYIGFGYDGNMPEMNGLEEEEGEDGPQVESDTEENEIEETEEIEQDIENNESEENESMEPVINLSEVPEGLQILNITLEISSPDYEHFQALLQEIEKQQRKMIVTNLQFDKPAENELIFGIADEEAEEVEGEAEEADEDMFDETITATMNITTFYFEG